MQNVLVRERPVITGPADNGPPPLLAALDRLGVKPFTIESVEEYKHAMAKAHPPNFWWRFDNKFGKRSVAWFLERFGRQILLGLFALPVGAGVVAMHFVGSPGNLFSGASLGLLAGLSTLVAEMVFLFFIGTRTAIGPAKWLNRSYFDERTTAPKEIQAFVRRLMKEVPGIQFTVDVLMQERYELDPILWAELCEKDNLLERYPTAVWNQKGFCDVG